MYLNVFIIGGGAAFFSTLSSIYIGLYGFHLARMLSLI